MSKFQCEPCVTFFLNEKCRNLYFEEKFDISRHSARDVRYKCNGLQTKLNVEITEYMAINLLAEYQRDLQNCQ